MKKINIQKDIEKLKFLKPGEIVLLEGYLYTLRDQAHKRIVEAIKRGENLPFEIKNSCFFYVGPTPTKPGQIIGAAGPTTSYRMDPFTPFLLEKGLKIMIGKGKRNREVVEAIKKYGAIYFTTIGGAAALLASKIKSAEVILYEDLLSEAVRKLYIEDFPVIVNIDWYGNEFKRE